MSNTKEAGPGRAGRRLQRREALAGLAAGVASFACSAEVNDGDAPSDPSAPLASPESSSVAAPPVSGTAAPSSSGVTVPIPRSATDRVLLGSTGIEVSRLAIGSGSHGGSGNSDQRELGVDGFATQLVESYDRGITFWETADMYGTHQHVGEALRRVGRHNIVLLTKSVARTAEQMEADLARFRTELGTDVIDIILLHQCESSTWTSEREGAMQVLADAKQRGEIRAHGISCHTLAAHELAVESDWVDVDLGRLNPFGLHMDGRPEQVVPVLERVKASGTALIGMKILALGDRPSQLDECLAYALNQPCLDAFTIGFANTAQLDEVMNRIAAL